MRRKKAEEKKKGRGRKDVPPETRRRLRRQLDS